MYIINTDKNELDEIPSITFSEAGFKERNDLQEWIAKNPQCLGEELLIIQKEFAGFDETKERLDLLAIDKMGNLVIIENKLDSTGKDVVWQSLKYVSYCSGLVTSDIESMYGEYLHSMNSNDDARNNLTEFFDDEDYGEKLNIGYSQRIILVAGSYRKEVTSTVMWLLNNGIDITCFKATPFKLKDEYIIDFKKIIPLEDVEEFIIKIAEKQKKEVLSQRVRGSRQEKIKSFWSYFLETSNQSEKIKNLTNNLTARYDSWIPIGIGKTGVSLNLVVSKKYARSEIYINRGKQELNKITFDLFLKHKEEIEAEVGSSLEWERMDEKVTSRIKLEDNTLNVYNEDDRDKMVLFLLDAAERMQPVFEKYIQIIDKE